MMKETLARIHHCDPDPPDTQTMMTPASRYHMLHKMGLVGPMPSANQQRTWALIDNRIPPVGEPDGEFTSFVQWVNKASSWIGFTGAQCFDNLDRPCRNGADMQRAHEESAFPVRWYWPDRFPMPQVFSKPVEIALVALLKSNNPIPASKIPSTGTGPARPSVIRNLVKCRLIEETNEGYRLTEFGRAETLFNQHRKLQASYVRKQ